MVVNGDRGRPQGKCHRKDTARAKALVRVKRRGKSSPLFRRRKRQGKPHPEQDQIGERLRAARLMFSGSVARGVRQLTSQMNDHRRVEGNRYTKQNSAYDLLPAFLP